MKKYKRLFEDEEVEKEISNSMYSELKSQRKKFKAKSSNQIYIDAAKIVAKELKIKRRDILKLYTPSNNLDGDKTWDKEGNIK